MIPTIASISQQLIQDSPLLSEGLYLKIYDCRLELRSNSKELIEKLRLYFSDCNVISDNSSAADINIIAIESASPELGINFIDWKREPGKTGRKDEYFDLDKARVVRKVRTGMVFLQSEKNIIAAGPCIKYDNQVINFINSQYMNWLQHRDWLICHASGLVIDNGLESNALKSNALKRKGLAIAGFSGGGKSTLMLEFMNDPAISFMTNDRLFIKSSKKPSTPPEMTGIPKLPRINPGTIIGNPLLHSLMSSREIDHYQGMKKEQLWDIEEKYDVSIKQVYGEQRLQDHSSLFAFIILNWQRDSNESVTLCEVNLEQRRDLLKAIMKPSGPFYQDTEAKFQTDDIQFDENAYLSILSGVKIYEAHGGINFKQLAELCKTNLL